MNQINIDALDTPVLNIQQLTGYHTNDQILSQIGRFVVTVITNGNCNVILPSAAAFRLGTANFFVADVTGGGGVISMTTADGSVINGQSSFVFSSPFQSASVQLIDGEWFTPIVGGSSGPTVSSGIYTPTLTAVANISSTQANQCQWMRIGNVVNVSGIVTINVICSTGNTLTLLYISLPFASVFYAPNNVGGTAFAQIGSFPGQGAIITANTTNNKAQLEFIAGERGTVDLSIVYTYLIASV